MKLTEYVDMEGLIQGLTDKQRRFLEAYALVGSVKKACETAGVARSSYYNEWSKKNEIRLLVEEIDNRKQEMALDEERDNLKMAEAQLLENIKSGKENSLFFYLKNRAPKRWRNDYIQGQEYIQNNTYQQLNIFNDKYSDMSNKELLQKAQELLRGGMGDTSVEAVSETKVEETHGEKGTSGGSVDKRRDADKDAIEATYETDA